MGVGQDLLKDNKPLKIAVTVFVIAGVAVVSIWAGKKIIKSIKKDQSKVTSDDLGKEVNNNNIYHTDAEFKVMADTIFSALDYSANFSWDVLESQLKKLKSVDEWKKLNAVFGVRKANATFLWMNGNLIEWLNYKLGYYYRPKAAAILSKIGVTF
jgi:hypothetical protein